jgi:hypothetical protein
VAIFILDPTYPENEENADEFEAKLHKRLRSAVPGVEILQADAGPSASIPGWMAKYGAIGWFIFSAPDTIAGNFPIWQSAFEAVLEIAEELGAGVSIDVHDAAAVAIRHCADEFGCTADKLKIVGVHAHCANLNGIWAANFDLDKLSEGADNLELHQQAVEQLNCRYIVLVEYEFEAKSVLVNASGNVEYAANLARD